MHSTNNFSSANSRLVHGCRVWQFATFTLCALILSTMSSVAVAALSVDNFGATTNDRFANDLAFIGSANDWSGVGRVGNRWVTMIDENIFLSALHFPPANGGTAIFYTDNDPSGTPVTRTVVGGTGLCGSDLYIGHLDFAVGSSIEKYAYSTTLIASQGQYDATIDGDFVFQTGVSPTTTGYGGPSATDMTLGENHAEGFNFDATVTGDPSTGDVLYTINNEPGDSGFTYETHDSDVNIGESGSPLMFPDANGDLVVYGIAWAQADFNIGGGVTRPGSIYTYTAQDADCLVEINNYIDANITALVPEPNAGLMLLFGASLLLLRRRSS